MTGLLCSRMISHFHPAIADLIWASDLGTFSHKVQCVGAFIYLTKYDIKNTHQPSVHWLIAHNIPIWYQWDEDEVKWAKHDPVFAQFGPPTKWWNTRVICKSSWLFCHQRQKNHQERIFWKMWGKLSPSFKYGDHIRVWKMLESRMKPMSWPPVNNCWLDFRRVGDLDPSLWHGSARS